LRDDTGREGALEVPAVQEVADDGRVIETVYRLYIHYDRMTVDVSAEASQNIGCVA
jgi:hypothetical protein